MGMYNLYEDTQIAYEQSLEMHNRQVEDIREGTLAKQRFYVKASGNWLTYIDPKRRMKVLDGLTDQELIKLVKENPDAIYNIKHPRDLVIKLAAGLK